ncbi:MAG: endonuclease III [Pelagibacterales bacterium]|nr:endonuclease III [Pelagibacterales bacterium]|tara:strand:+ start:757 stop:1377 length:621 start_codon:yes stop_codon:yes gene_type:complete
MNKNIKKIFEIFKDNNPEPKGELVYSSSYTLLVAVVLSAQATDVSVNKATKNLFKLAKTPKEMISIGEEKVIENIKSIGLYKNKAKNVINLSKILLEKFNGEVPPSLEELQSLPGVGRKTANVVLNMAFDIPTVAVDTHVFRVSNRTKIAVGKNVNEVELALLKNIPKKYLYHAHHWLILHGRYICKARKPLCDKCPILDLCPFNL